MNLRFSMPGVVLAINTDESRSASTITTYTKQLLTWCVDGLPGNDPNNGGRPPTIGKIAFLACVAPDGANGVSRTLTTITVQFNASACPFTNPIRKRVTWWFNLEILHFNVKTNVLNISYIAASEKLVRFYPSVRPRVPNVGLVNLPVLKSRQPSLTM